MDQDKNGGPNFLREWRQFRNLTQPALAERVRTTASVIHYLETGERGLSSKWLRRLAPELETTPGMLLDYDPNVLDTDLVEMWASAPLAKKRQIVEIMRTILRDDGGD